MLAPVVAAQLMMRTRTRVVLSLVAFSAFHIWIVADNHTDVTDDDTVVVALVSHIVLAVFSLAPRHWWWRRNPTTCTSKVARKPQLLQRWRRAPTLRERRVVDVADVGTLPPWVSTGCVTCETNYRYRLRILLKKTRCSFYHNVVTCGNNVFMLLRKAVK